MVVICGTGVVAPLIECPCTFTVLEMFALQYGVCNESPATRAWGVVLIPQIRGLAFAISITAGSASMNGLQAMLSGVSMRVRGMENEGIDRMGRDFEWKRKVRTVFSGLTIVVALLFLGTYLLPGFRQCESDDLLDKPNDLDNVRMTYSLGPISTSLFNALLAIGQMFISDILFRSTAVFYHQAEHNDEDDDKSSVDGEGGQTAVTIRSLRVSGSGRTGGTGTSNRTTSDSGVAEIRSVASTRTIGSGVADIRTLASSRTVESEFPEIGSIDNLRRA